MTRPALTSALANATTLLALALLAACSNQSPATSDPQPVAAESTPSPTIEHDSQPLPPPVLPPERNLDVTVEGVTEVRTATLFRSPQGYAIYVLPQIVMTQEEPCCDLAYARVDDGFFMRIERLADDADLATLRTNMDLALSSVGAAADLPKANIHAEAFRDAELARHADNGDARVIMLVGRAGEGRYRVTLHLPRREAAEGIVPTLWATLDSLETSGPLRRP